MISATNLKGIIVPIVTPVTAHGAVDHDGLRRVVRHVLDGGVHGVSALGEPAIPLRLPQSSAWRSGARSCRKRKKRVLS